MEKIVNGKEGSAFVLINNNEGCAGTSLLYSFVKYRCHSGNLLEIFLFNHHPHDFANLLELSHDGNIVIHDCFSDPFGWENGDVSKKFCLSLSVDKSEKFEGKNVVVIIDSLSVLLNICSQLSFHWKIQKLLLNKNVVQIVALLDSHLHNPELCKSVQHMASTVFDITNEASQFNSMDLNKKLMSGFPRKNIGVCSSTHHKLNGKVLTASEEFQIVPKKFSLIASKWKPIHADETAKKILPQEDPFSGNDSGLTFNLSLSKTEQQQRSKLVMPYTKVQLESDQKTGTIHYEADEADLFDDDPDDDLDF